MNESALSHFVFSLVVVLAAGLVAGLICKRFNGSLLVGFLLVGTLIGQGGLNLVTQQGHELEALAEAGALFLLFAVGLEFPLDELRRLQRFFFVGGSLQMVCVALPLTIAAHFIGKFPWNAAILAGAAGALSSTVLVYKSLAESGQITMPAGRRAIGILLFQDVALVPLMLFVPLLTGHGQEPIATAFALLLAKAFAFVVLTALLQTGISRWGVNYLAELRSVELVMLFTLVILAGMCWTAYQFGLPAAIGALAAGLVLSGNRLTKQIDAIVLPYRESFASVFFVTLGMLLHPLAFFSEPLLLLMGLIGILSLKTLAAWIALRVVGLSNQAAWGMGIGLAQLGEFSFLVVSLGVSQGLISTENYNRILFIALGTLILTPVLLRFGLRFIGLPSEDLPIASQSVQRDAFESALVIGIGPIGRRVATLLESAGIAVTVLDLSPVNLYPFAQEGFATVTGDARDRAVLRQAGIDQCRLIFICVPDDAIAEAIVLSVRELRPTASVLVRSRYEFNSRRLEKAGASIIVSEESEASGRLLQHCQEAIQSANRIPPQRRSTE